MHDLHEVIGLTTAETIYAPSSCNEPAPAYVHRFLHVIIINHINAS